MFIIHKKLNEFHDTVGILSCNCTLSKHVLRLYPRSKRAAVVVWKKKFEIIALFKFNYFKDALLKSFFKFVSIFSDLAHEFFLQFISTDLSSWLQHIGRNQRYSFQIDLGHSSSTLVYQIDV